MENLKHLTDTEKRKWLINEMQTTWRCNDVYEEAAYEDDNLVVCGNAGITFGDILKLCQQLEWNGFRFGNMEIFINIASSSREAFKDLDSNFGIGACHLPTPDEFSIDNGIIRIWWD